MSDDPETTPTPTDPISTPPGTSSFMKPKFFTAPTKAKPAPRPKADRALSETALLKAQLAEQAALIEALRAEMQAAPLNPAMAQMAQAMQAQTAQTAELTKSVERTVRRSNAVALGISAQNYDARCPICRRNAEALAAGTPTALQKHDPHAADFAHPTPPLTYETYFCGSRQRADQLTPLEIELFNSFTESKTARNGRFSATIKQDGTKRQLHVWIPCTNSEDLASAPPLTTVLSELLFGPSVADPMSAMAEIAALKAQVAALSARTVPA
jgi:hypothetical protein